MKAKKKPSENLFDETLNDWEITRKGARLWARDASLWSGHDESRWLDWLTIVDRQLKRIPELNLLQEEVRAAGFTHAALLGMGGSSLAPEVFARALGNQYGFPKFHVLDSTDPDQIRDLETELDLAKTLFIVSSKSGTTLEPNIFLEYFFARTDGASRQFIAITDPGSALEKIARQRKFRHVFHGVPGIGGRYSALSDFGMVPAAILGIDVGRFLWGARQMVQKCSATVPPAENPGVLLGTALGTEAKKGRNKVTLIASDRIQSFTSWIEQLLAESTGKNGQGLIPITSEQLGPPEVYGSDRFFIYLRLEGGADQEIDRKIGALRDAGQPVLEIQVKGLDALGQEFFRWEFATAVAGSILGINAFDQPDVEASKKETRRLTDEFEKTRTLPEEKPFFEEYGIALFADERGTRELLARAGKKPTLISILGTHLASLEASDYFAILAYIDSNLEDEGILELLRHEVRDAKKVATCLEYGPRFLHSTGQAYKGGPNSGVFLQITHSDALDLPIPNHLYTFGLVKAAQARGDFTVLTARGRRCLRAHLSGKRRDGLRTISAAVRAALGRS